MALNLADFIRNTTESLKPLHVNYTHAMWEAATSGTEGANESEKFSQAELMRFWADEARFERAKGFHEDGTASDERTTRLIKRIYLAAAKAQQDEVSIVRITQLEAEIRDQYYNFRGQVDGVALSDNELDEIIQKSRDSERAQKAWEASKQIGVLVADQVRELSMVRNAAAQAQGYRDHFERSLTLSEIDEGELFTIFDELEQVTREPFTNYKDELDEELARKFNIGVQELRPWHYGDRFFQSVPDSEELDMDSLFAGKDPVELAINTYDGMGLEVRDIILRSDLYPREGKNQHAFCLDLDREGDIRTLNNIEPNLRWTKTLLHELGHAVYDKYLDRELPWILRTPPHTLSTEAIAIMMGGLTSDEIWLRDVLQVPGPLVDDLVAFSKRRDRAAGLIFTRWVLVMTNFERIMYADPEADLDTIWWDLVEKYQHINRPDGRHAPDWAAKYHIPLAPVYYQNYELGMLVKAQFEAELALEFGGIVGVESAGHWLVENVFRSGNLEDWSKHVETVTGEKLTPRYFVESIT
jgi:peptidyl-dipeptidase A